MTNGNYDQYKSTFLLADVASNALRRVSCLKVTEGLNSSCWLTMDLVKDEGENHVITIK